MSLATQNVTSQLFLIPMGAARSLGPVDIKAFRSPCRPFFGVPQSLPVLQMQVLSRPAQRRHTDECGLATGVGDVLLFVIMMTTMASTMGMMVVVIWLMLLDFTPPCLFALPALTTEERHHQHHNIVLSLHSSSFITVVFEPTCAEAAKHPSRYKLLGSWLPRWTPCNSKLKSSNFVSDPKAVV